MQTLKRGASGTDVELLQRLLSKKGYHVGADGIFGNNTEVEVRNSQKDCGLVADGIVGQCTWDMLQSDSASLWLPCVSLNQISNTQQSCLGWKLRQLRLCLK